MSNTKTLTDIYYQTKQLSIKYDSYFPVYEALLEPYRGKKITLVEVGVFNGGSLFMWREFLGENARIIGIDLNPIAKDWEQHGFEIFIGDQSDEAFWTDFYSKVGLIDIFIDDGGHTNAQQIITSHYAIQNINDGGVLIVEDVHTSYFKEFGNPFKYSFVNWAYFIANTINTRASALKRIKSIYSSKIYSVSFFESMVVFNINSKLCSQSKPTTNHGATKNAFDFRYYGSFQESIFKIKNRVQNSTHSNHFLYRVAGYLLSLIQFTYSRTDISKYKKFF